MVRLGFVKFGQVKFGVVRLGVVKFGVVRLGVVKFGVVRLGVVKFGVVRLGVVRLGVVGLGNGQLSDGRLGRHGDVRLNRRRPRIRWPLVGCERVRIRRWLVRGGFSLRLGGRL